MSQSALDASPSTVLDTCDFDQNYRYLKMLLKELKSQNGTSVKKAIFGENRKSRALTKKQMKALAAFLRKIEHTYSECSTPPIPDELEEAIRGRDSDDWLPWELEAIEKVDAWREELHDRKRVALEMFSLTLQKVREGTDVSVAR